MNNTNSNSIIVVAKIMIITVFLRLREIRENLEKIFYSGRTWRTQGKIWILPDLRENSRKIFVWSQKKFRGCFLIFFSVYAIQSNTYLSKDRFNLSLPNKDTLLLPQYLSLQCYYLQQGLF